MTFVWILIGIIIGLLVGGLIVHSHYQGILVEKDLYFDEELEVFDQPAYISGWLAAGEDSAYILDRYKYHFEK